MEPDCMDLEEETLIKEEPASIKEEHESESSDCENELGTKWEDTSRRENEVIVPDRDKIPETSEHNLPTAESQNKDCPEEEAENEDVDISSIKSESEEDHIDEILEVKLEEGSKEISIPDTVTNDKIRVQKLPVVESMIFNIKRLIHLVKERPILWDLSVKGYRDRDLTLPVWEEVWSKLHEEFELLDTKGKNAFGKRVLKKWTNIKDSWLKSEKKLNKGIPGKKYIYRDQLTFLRKNKTAVKSGFSARRSERNIVHLTSQSTEEPSSSTVTRNLKKKQKVAGNKLKVTKTFDTPEHHHFLFFKSIVPSLQQFDEEEILSFQVGVLELIRDIRMIRSANQPA